MFIGLLLAALVAGVWWGVRRRAVARRPGADVVAGDRNGTNGGAPRSSRPELVARRRDLIRAVAALDLEARGGTIGAEDYGRRRGALIRRIRSLDRDLGAPEQ